MRGQVSSETLIAATCLLFSLATAASVAPAEDSATRPISELCPDLPFNSFPPNQLLRQANAQGGAVSSLHAGKPGTWAEFFIQVDRPGTYRVDVDVAKGPDKGVLQLLVNGDPVGEPVDCYTAGAQSIVTIPAGEVTLLKSANDSFRFLVTGKNAASSGFDVALQRLTLTPIKGFTLLSPNGSCQADGNVLLRWNSDPQARQYRVEVDGSIVSTVDAPATIWQTTNLAAGPHRWRVVAVRADGKLQPSNMFSFVVGNPAPYPSREFSEDFSSLNPDDWLLQSMTVGKTGGIPGLEASGLGSALQRTVRLDKTEAELSVKIAPESADSAAGVGFQADDGTQLYAAVDLSRNELRIERKLVGPARYSIFDVTPKAYQVKGWKERTEGDATIWEIASTPITLKAGLTYELKLAYSRRAGCVMATMLASDGSPAVTLRDLTDLRTPDRPVLLSLSGKANFQDVSLHLLNKLVYRWDPDSTRIVLRPGDAGAWDEKGAFNPAIIVRHGTWYMVYRGNAKPAPPSGPARSELGVARSTDGVHWIKDPGNPILAITPAQSTVEDPDLLLPDATDTYYLEYVILRPKGYLPNEPGVHEMMATSTDGIHYSEPWRLPVKGKIGGMIDTHTAPAIPEFDFGGKKYRYLGFIEEGGVYLSNDLHQWDKMGEADLKGRPDMWCNFHECAGDIFVDADHNLRIEAQAGTDKRVSGNRLCTNVEDVLNSRDPTTVIARGDLPWLPDWYGDAPTGAPEDFTATNGSVFPGQTIVHDGWLWHYSGGNNHSTLLTKCWYGPLMECRNLQAVSDASGPCAASVTVRNTGSLAGTGSVTLSLDGKPVAHELPTLDRNAEKTLEWKVSVPAGIHTLSVENLSFTLKH
jgi:hypothetical protein